MLLLFSCFSTEWVVDLNTKVKAGSFASVKILAFTVRYPYTVSMQYNLKSNIAPIVTSGAVERDGGGRVGPGAEAPPQSAKGGLVPPQIDTVPNSSKKIEIL